MTRARGVAESLSPRERVRLALDHRETDRVPIADVCGGLEGTTRSDLARHLGVDVGEGIDRYLERFLDVAVVSPDYRGPTLGRRPDGSYEDIWGVWRSPISYGAGVYYEISFYPLAEMTDISELNGHRWPDPDWWDYASFPERIAQATARRDYALCVLSGNPFERTWWARGYELSLLDMIERPGFFNEVMRRVTDFYVEFTRRVIGAAGRHIELAFTADDIGSQRGLLISLPMWEEHIKPHHARLNRVIHEFGTKVMYHSDGAVMDAIPGLIDMGVDVLQALQFSADGMDPVVMKEEYGDRLCFEGGISVQTTLPFGTVEEVRQEVRDRIRVLARNGGYLLGPSHAIQSGTPPENIAAMFETAASYPMGGAGSSGGDT